MTSAMALNLASNRSGIRLAPPTHTRPLQVEKPFQVPYRPVQRPLFQPDKIQKPFTSATSEGDVEVIDLSADDCVQVINVSSSAEDEMLTGEVVPLNVSCEESGCSKVRSEVKKEENPQACSGNEKDFSHSEALPKDMSQEVASRKDSLKEAFSVKDLSKPIMAAIDIPALAKDLSKAVMRQKEFSRLAASSKELSKAAESPKAISKPIPSQNSILASGSVTALSKDAPNPAFLKTTAFTKGQRPIKDTLQFYSATKSSMLDKSTRAALEYIRTEPYRKALMPPSLLSNKALLSTLPQETQNLLIAPQKIMQQQSSAGNQASNVAGKWSLAPQPSHSNQQAGVRVRPLSPSPSEQSSSSLSENNEDEKDEVIELSSSIDSD